MPASDRPTGARSTAVDLRRLAAFVAAAEESHFGRAARRLDVSQPTLSQHVKTLESEWDVRLFVRAARGVRPTEAGRRLLPAARRLLRAADGFRLEVDAVVAGHRGAVSIGYVDEAFAAVMPGLVAMLAADDPDPRCSTSRLAGPLDAARSLRDGRHDAVVTDPRHLDVDAARVAVARIPYVAAAPAGHPLARPARLDLATVLRDPGLLRGAAGPSSVVADGPVRDDGLHGLLLRVAAGRGVAVVPETARAAMPLRGVVYRDLDGAPAMPLVIAWSRTNPNSALEAVARAARSIGRGATPRPGVAVRVTTDGPAAGAVGGGGRATVRGV
ncbi:MAG: LysR family transcriptional regulator [Solirubrobacteraceae bacterium]|nr:LysR family transcriptional regulator [Solirubrobacteraceae bacterium]